ncbi:MAG: hypothetical protein UT12_C0012G0006 [Candidatus Curtissbacteria bacterium GW2011_GWC2_38_9]|uniref:Transcriptional repressor PaaX-like central Cas2-like domain-containing protein n=3 Tax=Candidatus Curtissiibacteriota TaxID=1752717 RepID=A0A1F5HQY5_9BACT|nr:MAG: hypothetical protein UT12_C0012G0006 [Candidatus Curtissbacteria bacterium GW2011_GWC2_38_9]KKS04012.1 MAG: hypothetical protein UU56_C0011G0006 [Candidatus Curtissbacteria bacterium GW2011_GWA2_41_24]OGE06415.1 MAG: hypothetical protein A2W70_00940 [Candidatus Curtissbacteria bacterium RIFCSPLOWO2_02_41_11]
MKVISQVKIDPKTKEVLMLLGAGAFLAASIIFPGLPMAAKPFIDVVKEADRNKRQKEWEKFNLWRLRQVIKRMQSSKLVEVKEEKGVPIIKITHKGKQKLLRYKIDEMVLESNWDGKWRLVIYDVQTGKRANSEMFRTMLNKLRFLKLQRSVYLTPFKCEDEIEYLRLLFEIGNEVQILKVGSLENEAAYRRYFGI